MNRDWFAQTQPETRGRIRIALEYFPQVNVDLHEQGGNNSYYFAPPADPINPHYTKAQLAGFDLFGRANGARFDERGWAYYIREVYDGFYPGYGDSWPMMHGSIGMTYEQASARALSFARSDDTVLTYRDGVMHHFNAAITTAITAAREPRAAGARLPRVPPERRGRRREGRRCASTCWCPGTIRRGRPRWRGTWRRRASRCAAPTRPLTVGTRKVPAGAYLVSNAQPAARLVRNLLDLDTKQDAPFIARQEERRKRRQPDQIYDITAWSLPLMYDVEVVTSADGRSAVAATPVPARLRRGAGRAHRGGRQGRAISCRGASAGRGAHGRRRRRRACACTAWAARSRSADAPIPSAPRSCARPATRPTCRRACRRWPRSTAPRSCPSTRPMWSPAPRSAATTSAFVKAPRVLLAWDQPTSTPVGRLDALRARAPLRPEDDHRAHVVARPRELRRLRRRGAAVGQLRRTRSATPCWPGSRTGSAWAARS